MRTGNTRSNGEGDKSNDTTHIRGKRNKDEDIQCNKDRQNTIQNYNSELMVTFYQFRIYSKILNETRHRRPNRQLQMILATLKGN